MSMIYRPEDFSEQFSSIANGVSNLLNVRARREAQNAELANLNRSAELARLGAAGDSDAFGQLAGLSPAAANALTNRFMAPYEQQLLRSRSMAAEAESLHNANEAKKRDDIANVKRLTAYGSLALKAQSPEQKRMAWNALRGNLMGDDGNPNEIGSRLMQSLGIDKLPMDYPGDEFVHSGVDIMQGLLHSLGEGPKPESSYGREAADLGFLEGTKSYNDTVKRLMAQDNAEKNKRAAASAPKVIVGDNGEKNAPLDSVGRRAAITDLMQDQNALSQIQMLQDSWQKKFNKTLPQAQLKVLERLDKHLPDSALSQSQREEIKEYQGYVSNLKSTVLDYLLKYAATTFTDSTRAYIEGLLPTENDSPTTAEEKLVQVKGILQRSIAVKVHALTNGVAVDTPEGIDYINKRIMGGFDPRRSQEATRSVKAYSVAEFRRELDQNPKTRNLDPARKDAMAKSMAEDSMRQMGFNK